MTFDTLFLIGFTIFFGTICGKVFQKLRIPQVTGYIIAGFVLGKSVLNLWSPEVVVSMDPLVNLALAMIGFLLGGELHFDVFRNRGRSIYSILLFQGLLTFILVTVFVTWLTQKLYLGILLGAIASATAPAATVDVLWEYKSRGPLTSTLMAIVALDDILALVLYAFASIFAKAMVVEAELSLMRLSHAFVEIGIATALGAFSGVALYWLIHTLKDRERLLPFALSIIAITAGIAMHFKTDLILSSMLVGLTLVNLAPQESKDIFEAIRKFSPPIYVLFFALVGARLDLGLVMTAGVPMLLVVFALTRMGGKIFGSYLGGLVGRAPGAVTRYLGLGLFSQAGVAIGMSIAIFHKLHHFGPEAAQTGLLIVNITVAATFIFQLIGPPCVKLAVAKAGELWRNVTEEDIIDSYKVADMIEKDVPVLHEDTPLDTVVDSVKQCDSYHFCVVDAKDRLIGVMSLGDLRDILLEAEVGLNQLVRAGDVAIPATRIIESGRPLKEAMDIFRSRELDFLPVVRDLRTKEFYGLIHYRFVMREVNKELLARRGDAA